MAIDETPIQKNVHSKTDFLRTITLPLRRQRIERWVNKGRYTSTRKDEELRSSTTLRTSSRPNRSEIALLQADRRLNIQLFQLGKQRQKFIDRRNYDQKLFATKQVLRHKDNQAIHDTLNYVRKCCKNSDLYENDNDHSAVVSKGNDTTKTVRSRSMEHTVANPSPSVTKPTEMPHDEKKDNLHISTKLVSQSAHVSNKSRPPVYNERPNRNIKSGNEMRLYEDCTTNSSTPVSIVEHRKEQSKPSLKLKSQNSKLFITKSSVQKFHQYPERFLSKSNRYLPLLRHQVLIIESHEYHLKQINERTKSSPPVSRFSSESYLTDDEQTPSSEQTEDTRKSKLNPHTTNWISHDQKTKKEEIHTLGRLDLSDPITNENQERKLALSNLRDHEYARLQALIHSNRIEHILTPFSSVKTFETGLPQSVSRRGNLNSIDSVLYSKIHNDKYERKPVDINKNLSKLGEDNKLNRRRSYEVQNEAALLNNIRTNSVPMILVKDRMVEEEENSKKENNIILTEVTTVTKSSQPQGEVREQWSEKLDFLLSIIGFAVDLANIWRFPYLCYKNGGGAFLIPYVLSVILGGMPLFYLELLLGQYYRQGSITCWKKICPLLAGIGWAVTIIAFYTDFYYNVVISWGLYYLFASLKRYLPWSECNHSWNTKDCFTVNIRRNFLENCMNRTNNTLSSSTRLLDRSSLYENCSEELTRSRIVSPAQEYFHLQVYRLQPERNLSLGNLGHINYENLACLAIIYLICYFSMWKGIKTSGKVVWFTALFPYVVLTILMIRGLFLEGAMKGIQYYIRPDLSKLTDASVWVDAASQTFFSLGPGFGVLMAFASYNDFHHNVYRDAMITVAVNSLTSFASGFVIFMFLGYMSEISGRDIKDVAEQGSTLVFIVYPEAIATMPWAPVWAVFFFLMLLTLGLDSSFGGSEAIITALSDVFPVLRQHREWFVGILFSLYFVIGIPSCTDAGVYFVELLQNYAAFYSIIIAVLFEAIAVSWLYGIERISEDVKEMLGTKPGKFWIITWCLIAPLFLGGIVLSGLIQHVHPNYGKVTDPFYYEYPDWSHLVGWGFALSSVIFIPIVAIYQLLIERGSLATRFRLAITPWKERQKHINPDIIIKFCQTNDCRGGDCEIISLPNGLTKKTCHCIQGVCGETCQRLCNATSKCDAHPCWFGGTCVDVANLDYVCLCPPNHTGKDCRTLLSCQTDSCHNDGTCIQTPNGARCNCPENFRGDYCQYTTAAKVNKKAPPTQSRPQNNQDIIAAIAAISSSNTNNAPVIQRTNSFVVTMGDHAKFVFCLTNPCENEGTCFVTNTATTKGICVCREGFIGDYCEHLHNKTSTEVQGYRSYCSSGPCLNDGVCIEDGKSNGYCRCQPEFRGTYCEVVIRTYSCNPNPCKNGGTCVLLENNQAKCLCTSVFRGVTCSQFSYLPCGDATCHGTQGVCAANKCVCKTGFAGPRCDSTDFCSAYPCLNGGTCVRTNEEPFGGCSCLREFSGPTCSNDPCSPSPCLNGGYCVRKPDNQFYCQCRNRNRGVYCEQQECFPSDATVDLINVGKVKLSALKIGDQVRVIDDENQIIYSPIISFLHRELDEEASYRRIRTKTAVIELSDRHLINQRNNGFVWAESLAKGDEILVLSAKSSNKTIWEKIIEITEVDKQGLMAPLTEQGTIIVNNVHVSCYALVRSHALGHIALTPYRWYVRIFGLPSDNNTTPILGYANTLLQFFKNLPIARDIIF
ncbi:unnamed protein product [Rotaria socialis]|uniref:Transporter n=2 Tax=Rotaria socialis TaxID=392032 RepID=A0A817UQ47_9BILA|nr:unnamed protein product [Rotaria socialis]